jgi:hypothetical protein
MTSVFSLSIAWRWMFKCQVFSNDFMTAKSLPVFASSHVHLVSETNAIAYIRLYVADTISCGARKLLSLSEAPTVQL